MKAIILAGGLGKRLRPLTDTVPKSMIEVAGKPILLRQIEWLKLYGVSEVVLCVGHLMEKIKDCFRDGSGEGISIHYVEEQTPLGTGGALYNALPYFPPSGPFFAMNGDIITDLDLSALLQKLETGPFVAAIALVPLPSPFGIVETDDSDVVVSFKEKPRLSTHWINGGVYCFTPAIKEYLLQKGSIEHNVFPKLAEEGLLGARKFADCFWASIDSPKDIDEAAKHLAGDEEEPPDRPPINLQSNQD